MPVLNPPTPANDEETPRHHSGRISSVIKDWRIDEKLGTGSTAFVYAATHVRDGRRAALKILRDVSADDHDDATRKRFSREGYLANAVGHSGVVRIFDQGQTDDGALFIVMELLDGKSLEALRVERPGEVLPVHQVIDIGCELLDILASAHARGVIHRDLKPANVFLTGDGMVKVLDFGIAYIVKAANRSSSISRTGIVMGTPAFMPPEQACGRREEIDARSDLWALGATLFTLLSGRAVHAAPSHHAQLLAAMTKPAPSLKAVAPNVPQALVNVIDRALSFRREDRWEDAESMCKALRLARLPLAANVIAPQPSVPIDFSTPVVPDSELPILDSLPTPENTTDPPPNNDNDNASANNSVHDAVTRIGPALVAPHPDFVGDVSPALLDEYQGNTHVLRSPVMVAGAAQPPPPSQPQSLAPTQQSVAPRLQTRNVAQPAPVEPGFPSWLRTGLVGGGAGIVAGAIALLVILSAERIRHKTPAVGIVATEMTSSAPAAESPPPVLEKEKSEDPATAAPPAVPPSTTPPLLTANIEAPPPIPAVAAAPKKIVKKIARPAATPASADPSTADDSTATPAATPTATETPSPFKPAED